MPRRSKFWVVLGLLCVATPLVGRADSDPASATLPLEEIMRLYREQEARDQAAIPPPPTRAAVERLELEGRLLEDAIEITARITAVVMTQGAWVQLPLIEVDDSMQVVKLPELEGAALSVEDGRLTLSTQTAGRVTMEVSLRKEAQAQGRDRVARISFPSAALAWLRLHYDEGLFVLDGTGAGLKPEGAVLFPRQGVITVRWRRRAEVATTLTVSQREHVPVEPVVMEAHASSVATLEGERLTRLLYQMRFEGVQRVALTLPPATTVRKVYLNGVAIPFSVERGALAIEVAHRRAGEELASLELLLMSPQGKYLLSGHTEVALPGISWTVNQLYVELHLPAVFNYQWAGGSLAPTEEVPAVKYTHPLPLPGKVMRFEQVLISGSAPRLAIDYTIDLAGRYFSTD